MSDLKTYTIPFSNCPINASETQRSAAELEAFMAAPGAECLILHQGRIGVDQNFALLRARPQDVARAELADPGVIFLGLDGERPVFAASLKGLFAGLGPEQFADLRQDGGKMSLPELASAGKARSLLDWHRTHGHCAQCGDFSVAAMGGLKRICASCETEHFPRVNPVVIMLVVDDQDRVLLGRSPGWPPNFYSALAGFISPGESLEEAVAREVMEESGIDCTDHRYVFSQPWPFPSQLMMGVISRAVTTEIKVDPDELEDARWFTRDEVDAVFNGGGGPFLRPPKVTIAHQLLRYWLKD